ncbi:hypothetical protein [Streptomyces sp. NPDC088554]|uniref:hypothetical protein n=1 Tax=Streptomyces sp. NPDC088554 TaxID=3365865 RepID=UPI00380E4BDA
MSLVKLIAQADERGLAASGVACLERCLPLFSEATDVLRPLWAAVVSGERDWPRRLAAARIALDDAIAVEIAEGGAAVDAAAVDVTTTLVRTMLGSAPADWAAEPLRAWADTCSVVALEIHQKLDAVGDSGADAPDQLARRREDVAGAPDAVDASEGGDGIGPLVAGELRRQIRILEILADTEGTGGLREAMDTSVEGQRVLRAVVSRRARARS